MSGPDPVAAEVEPPEAAVRAPAAGLVATGVLSLVMALLVVAWHTLGRELVPPAPGKGGVPLPAVLAWGAASAAIGALLVLAGRRMASLRAWRFCRAMSVLAMVPLAPCFAVGIPFGVWCRAVLAREDVRRAFR